jgi:hypothetical protein
MEDTYFRAKAVLGSLTFINSSSLLIHNPGVHASEQHVTKMLKLIIKVHLAVP